MTNNTAASCKKKSTLCCVFSLFLPTIIAAVLFFPFFVMQVIDKNSNLSLDQLHFYNYKIALSAVFVATVIIKNFTKLSVPTLALPKLSKNNVIPLLLLTTLLFPWLGNRAEIDLATVVLLAIALAWGMNIVVGYAGLLDLGYIAFYAIGAYSYALLNTVYGVSFWWAIPICIMTAALFSALIGFPILRLRGDYFAIVTLGFAEIVRTILINAQSVTGGPNGIADIARPTFFGWGGDDIQQRMILMYYIILFITVFLYFFCRRLRSLPLGMAWEAVREDEIAARSLGVNVRTAKLYAHIIAAMIASLCGAFFAAKQAFISPESFTFLDTAMVLAMVVLGGLGSTFGVAVAAILIVALPELARDFSDYRMLFFGVIMVIVMLFRPNGFASKRIPSIIFTGGRG